MTHVQESEDEEDEEAIRKEMADLIDSDEDLSDGIEYLQQKFRRDQAKDERELMKKVKAAAFAINKRTRFQFEEDQREQQDREDKVNIITYVLNPLANPNQRGHREA